MGHITGKDIYRRLAGTLDGTPVRTPDSPAFQNLLRELYTPEEAELIVRMPYRPSSLERIIAVSRLEHDHVRRLLERLCAKGLVIDIWNGHTASYMISPIVIGIFEFTMMRTGGNLPLGRWARLFNDYMFGDQAFFNANFGDGQRISVMRALPHAETVRGAGRVETLADAQPTNRANHAGSAPLGKNMAPDEIARNSPHAEILDYEHAAAIIDRHDIFSVGLCSCRHEHVHLNEEASSASATSPITSPDASPDASPCASSGASPSASHCKAPLDTCTSLGSGAEFLIRNGFARRIDKCEMLDILARSRDLGLTLSADNVRQDVGFICHCCGCCCNLMRGIKATGHQGILVTSSFMAECRADTCNGCGLCAKACPIDAIALHPRSTATCTGSSNKPNAGPRMQRLAVIDEKACLGCGVCALKCPTKALQLAPRKARVFHPEDSFERVILQSLERGTFQNLIFDNPTSRSHSFMRGLVGGFLRLDPVKRALMGEALRSRFLQAIRNVAL